MAASPETLRQALAGLRDLLREQQRHGVKRLAMRPESAELLRGLPRALAGMSRPGPTPPTATAPPARSGVFPELPPPSKPEPEPEPAPQAVALPPPVERRPEPEAPAKAAEPVPAGPQPLRLEPPPGSKAQRIAWLREHAEREPASRELPTLRERMVFSVGDPESRLMFVGEAPGQEEERLGEPFVGPAGEKLTGIIKAMGLSRPHVYISNVVKFRPRIGDGRFQGAKNRPPATEEIRACRPYLMAEIEVIRPSVIVALGSTAATGLLDIAECSVGRMRNRFHDLGGTPVMITYHPSYLLRHEKEPTEMQEKRKVWEDMLLVMEKMGLPISDKQRGYFLR